MRFCLMASMGQPSAVCPASCQPAAPELGPAAPELGPAALEVGPASATTSETAILAAAVSWPNRQ